MGEWVMRIICLVLFIIVCHNYGYEVARIILKYQKWPEETF